MTAGVTCVLARDNHRAMERHELIPHPDHPPFGATGVTVTLRQERDRVSLAYCVAGAGALVMPPLAPPARTDELWRTTCFELFARADDGGDAYVEFNFAPSTRWAAYAFDGCRAGMRALALAVPPAIERRDAGVSVVLPRVALPSADPLIALTAVIEEEGGRRSFWSLAHPAGAPDFHHRDCFVARLPAPETA